jgi:hypothetical protein
MKNDSIQTIISQLRTELLLIPFSSRGKRGRIPNELRMRIISGFKKSELRGAQYCKEIGISHSAFCRWHREQNPSLDLKASSLGFRKMAVESSCKALPQTKSWELQGPMNLKVSGLSVAEVASLWRELC